MDDGDTFIHRGVRFKVAVKPDEHCDPPWENSDGHGAVRSTYNYYGGPEKKPGERPMHSERGTHWLYDWQAAMETAKKDGWGLGPQGIADLTEKLMRAPTKGEITAEAVQRDFDFLSGWVRNDWHYVGVVVTELDAEGDEIDNPAAHDSLWGVEDSDDAYIEEVAHEIAGNLLHHRVQAWRQALADARERRASGGILAQRRKQPA